MSVLCACLDSYASLREHEKLQELGSSLLQVNYETRQNVNGAITLYTLSVDDEKLQTLLEGAQDLGAANLYSYLSAFEGIRIPQVQTKDAQECHFFFEMIDGKDGVCEFALCIESDLEGGQVAMGYQSDMGVSQLTEEELRKVNSGLEKHFPNKA